MGEDETIRGWLTGRLPADWFDGAAEVTVDREEILVVGAVPAPAPAEGASAAERAAAVAGRVREFRERTRDQRMRIAQELQHLAGRTVSWGVTVDGQRELFTTASVPVMTRLRQPERQVLDTLVDAGVARSRSDALAWCVRLVGRNADDWLADLRTAMEEVARVRAAGPS
jgi:hypothetical protein